MSTQSSTGRRVTTVFAALAIGLAGVAWTGCGGDSAEDQAGEVLDDAQNAIDDAQKNAPGEAQDAIDDAQQQAEDAYDDATN